MTKQEALEAVLAKMREWEETGAEVPARNPRWIMRQIMNAMEELQQAEAYDAHEWSTELIVIGAAALYLLRDEVDVVVPGALTLDLDEALARWTAEGGSGGGS